MITLAQLRMLIERSFSPLACECSITGNHSLTVKLYHPVSGQVDLVVSGLNLSRLQTTESVAALIEELRYELDSNSLQHPDPVM
ncbi:hypothetical protein B0D71_04560 [Pseudomonas laurylsulfativorans]|uniref:DUF1652 domain-containing protein n=1 Tax=Pseudomonas laurylsulfativorans TaxID=1943631 RepID=A0A2S3VVV2_9PSED|nr:DUF1652 domain-containing protein [Pseudomonas laurylsulfativorans]POF44070.1 hypothetical protein B0D71_04560 [Pseudomonas laurylsulfativorans]